MRWGVAGVALMVLLSARPANASLIQVDFATTILGSPLGDLPFSGNFIYDDLGTGNCTVTPMACDIGFVVPFLDLNLYLGTHHFTLAHATAGSTPQVFMPLGSNGWGPSYSVDGAYLPQGVSALGIGPGAAVFPYASFDTGAFFLSQCPSTECSFSLTQLPPRSVPGPSTLALVVLGGLLAVGRRASRVHRS